MSKINYYIFNTEGQPIKRKQDKNGEILYLEKHLQSDLEEFKDELSGSEQLLYQALSNPNHMIYLIGPSEKTSTNKKGETVQQYMLNVVDYTNPEKPISNFLKLNSYYDQGGSSLGYKIMKDPVEYHNFNEDLQTKYQLLSEHKSSKYQSSESEQGLSDDDKSVDDVIESPHM